MPHKDREKHLAYMREYNKTHGKDRSREHRFRRYKITEDQYLELLKTQGGVCAVCGGVSGNRRLAVDHDHVTGKIRGLLCQACNWALGLFKDNPETVFKGAVYLSERK